MAGPKLITNHKFSRGDKHTLDDKLLQANIVFDPRFKLWYHKKNRVYVNPSSRSWSDNWSRFHGKKSFKPSTSAQYGLSKMTPSSMRYLEGRDRSFRVSFESTIADLQAVALCALCNRVCRYRKMEVQHFSDCHPGQKLQFSRVNGYPIRVINTETNFIIVAGKDPDDPRSEYIAPEDVSRIRGLEVFKFNSLAKKMHVPSEFFGWPQVSGVCVRCWLAKDHSVCPGSISRGLYFLLSSYRGFKPQQLSGFYERLDDENYRSGLLAEAEHAATALPLPRSAGSKVLSRIKIKRFLEMLCNHPTPFKLSSIVRISSIGNITSKLFSIRVKHLREVMKKDEACLFIMLAMSKPELMRKIVMSMYGESKKITNEGQFRDFCNTDSRGIKHSWTFVHFFFEHCSTDKF